MTPAHTFPARRDGVRMLVVDPTAARLRSMRIADLPAVCAAGDLLVVNDAATLPASLRGADEDGRPIEIRLLALGADGSFRAVVFGTGDWRQRTEDRAQPPVLAPGAGLRFGTLEGRVVARSPLSYRIIDVAFNVHGAALWAALYREARPIQYSYLAHDLPLWAVQTVYASRPWAFEMPSAGRPLSWEILFALRRRGVRWAAVTHAAGLSSTGDPELDAALPMAERFEIPPATVDAIRETRRSDGRVIAVGTTVVRAVEGAVARWGTLRAGAAETELRLDARYRPRIVDGVLSGLHAPGESHFDLLGAFAPRRVLEAAAVKATREGYLTHELGDAMLVLTGALGGRLRRREMHVHTAPLESPSRRRSLRTHGPERRVDAAQGITARI